ncbi:unnamed protein product [Camellia sinensis]
MEGGDEGIERVVDSKDLQQQSKALDKLTDHVEDRQLDSTRVQEAMASIGAAKEADLNAMRLRESDRHCNRKSTKWLWTNMVYVGMLTSNCLFDGSLSNKIKPDNSVNVLQLPYNLLSGLNKVLTSPLSLRPLLVSSKHGEKELAAVKINAADVDIIANELELDKKVAERTLREHKGDAVAAIRSLLH